MVACDDEKQPLAVEAVARMPIDVPMKGLSAKSTTTPTKVPVAPPMAADRVKSSRRFPSVGPSTAGKGSRLRPPRSPTKKAEPHAAPTPLAAIQKGASARALHIGCQTNPERKVAHARKVAVCTSLAMLMLGTASDLSKKYAQWPVNTAPASPSPVVTK